MQGVKRIRIFICMFVDNDTVVAFGTKAIEIYTMKEKPVLKKHIVFNDDREGITSNQTVCITILSNLTKIIGCQCIFHDHVSYIFGTKAIEIYTMKEKPVLKKHIVFNDEIRSIFYGDDYIGVIQKNSFSFIV